MIVPILYGRLGNQCFQAAAAIAHAIKMKTSWALPHVTQDQRVWANYFLKQVPRDHITPYGMRRFIHNEPRHCYDTIPSHADLTINGYFQSEKYWPTHNEKYSIGNALGFHYDKKDYIAVHVRRGDYVTQFSDKHPPLEPMYYTEAIDYLISHGYDNFRVYSDDTEWCKKTFIQLGYNLEYSNIKDPLTAMRDMYNAAGFIIANSTFSLFPALLRLDNPITIAPDESNWFGPGNAHLSTIDLMPGRFIKF